MSEGGSQSLTAVLRPKDAHFTPTISINDTLLQRIFVLATLRLLGRILPHHGPVIMLSKNLCIKVGRLKQPAEAATMQFIANHTSIPVAKVYCAFEHKGCKYILMERIQGRILRDDWLGRSEESKAKILTQLKDMVSQMRSIPSPSGGQERVSNVVGGPLFDGRLPGGSYHGPFDTVQEFHRHLREGYEGDVGDPPDVKRLLEWHDRPREMPVVFTHGDLSSLNIMAQGDQVTGIIDWETAGWWPDYWEYTSAWHVNPYNEFWRDEVDRFLEPMGEELDMERLRRKFTGDF